MPWLKGNSSQGSKPMTWLFFTLSWMPHCWPQKQQWVLTKRSGSADVSSLSPPEYPRCGPNCAMVESKLSGGRTIFFSFFCLDKLRCACPYVPLSEDHQDSLAARAGPFIMILGSIPQIGRAHV